MGSIVDESYNLTTMLYQLIFKKTLLNGKNYIIFKDKEINVLDSVS